MLPCQEKMVNTIVESRPGPKPMADLVAEYFSTTWHFYCQDTNNRLKMLVEDEFENNEDVKRYYVGEICKVVGCKRVCPDDNVVSL